MRISADKDDPGYHDAYLLCVVYLDDEVLPMCITADEEHGEAVCAW